MCKAHCSAPQFFRWIQVTVVQNMAPLVFEKPKNIQAIEMANMAISAVDERLKQRSLMVRGESLGVSENEAESHPIIVSKDCCRCSLGQGEKKLFYYRSTFWRRLANSDTYRTTIYSDHFPASNLLQIHHAWIVMECGRNEPEGNTIA